MDLGTSGRQLRNQRYLNLAMGGRGSRQVLAHLAHSLPTCMYAASGSLAALDAKSGTNHSILTRVNVDGLRALKMLAIEPDTTLLGK